VITKSPYDLSQPEAIISSITDATPKLRDIQIEGLLIEVRAASDLQNLAQIAEALEGHIQFPILDLKSSIEYKLDDLPARAQILRHFTPENSQEIPHFLANTPQPILSLSPEIQDNDLLPLKDSKAILTLSDLRPQTSDLAPTDHPVGQYRRFANRLKTLGITAPIWIRNTADTAIEHGEHFLSKVIESSILSGSLLADGIGDLISIETEPDPARATILSYNVLQGAGSRISKTEFVACPSCGRTLFDLQTTTKRIREKTGHLKGVKIAIMGCIVNGPGEMADADFGYVGGAPGKINLYVGKECVKYNIPQAEADERLIDLIREHGKWIDAPETAEV
ncbi:MAG: flavodoxin-dependent (E)-4-hydroxy-3-methylbut-2-enyl-diphosphate synthase, partial [Verrucomicrobiota bacterium]